MKINKLTIILIIIILLLAGYIAYDKLMPINNSNETNDINDTIEIIDSIKLDYVSIYLTDDGYSYIVPFKSEEISELNLSKNLSERLNTLYDRGFYYDVYVNNFKIKGFRVKLDSDIKSIYKVDVDKNIYVIFLKENNTIGLFNYNDYYNSMYTDVTDNYHNLKNVLNVENNKIIYLDGSSEELI